MQIDPAVCDQGVPTILGMDQALGLPAGSYGEFKNLLGAEAGMGILGNMVDANACANQIEVLSCTDPTVQGAYGSGPGFGNPFAGVASMIPKIGPCGYVFLTSLRVTPTSVNATSGFPVQFQAFGGTAPYNFSLKAGSVGGLLVPQSPTQFSFNPPPAAGTAIAIVQDATGAQVEATISISTKPVTMVSASGNTTCAVVSGNIECWGKGINGQLGNGNLNSDVPTQLSPVQNAGVASIASAMNSSCSVVASNLFCWGLGTSGQIGNNGVSGSLSPTLATYGLPVLSVYGGTGGDTLCAIDSTSRLVCWGKNNNGQAGSGTAGTDVLAPSLVQGLVGVPANQASTGNFNSCAISNGNVYCWGENSSIGNGGTAGPNLIATPVSAFQSGTATKVSVGYDHACVVDAGFLYCWGSNAFGQLGVGGSVQPIPVPVAGPGVSDVSAGYYTTCAIVNNGVQCWGKNSNGQVGEDTGGTRWVRPIRFRRLFSRGRSPRFPSATTTRARSRGARFSAGA
jgi:hypothetical protein